MGMMRRREKLRHSFNCTKPTGQLKLVDTRDHTTVDIRMNPFTDMCYEPEVRGVLFHMDTCVPPVEVFEDYKMVVICVTVLGALLILIVVYTAKRFVLS